VNLQAVPDIDVPVELARQRWSIANGIVMRLERSTNGAVRHILDRVAPADLPHPFDRILASIERIDAAGLAPDALAIKADLRATGELEVVGDVVDLLHNDRVDPRELDIYVDRLVELNQKIADLDHHVEGVVAAGGLVAFPPVDASTELKRHTDSGVANMERLVRQHHQDVRYLDKVGWYSWDGRRFAPDAEADLTRRAIRTIREMYREAAGIEEQRDRTSFLNHIRKSESEPEIRRMVLLAASHADVHIPKPEHFDRDPMLFNLPNGTVNLRTRELHPHRRDDHITKLAGCAYDALATAPKWTSFLNTIFDGNTEMVSFVQRLAGYCLTGEVREHVLPILWGDGSNGKTTFIRTLLALLGDYGAPAPESLLVARKHKEHPTELMVLMGVRLAAAVETPLGAHLAESRVKSLTGNDVITAHKMFKDFITFIPTHKLLLATNHRPQVQGTDNAIWRRLLLVPFNVTIRPEEQDAHLLDKLLVELPGILNWALAGCRAWQEGGLRPPETVQVATESYREESDHMPAFMEECCVQAAIAKVEKGTLFTEYTGWCQRNAEAPMPKLELGRRLKALGITDEKSNGRRFWKGIGLVVKDGTS
jgi:putative DNA primase/helicase